MNVAEIPDFAIAKTHSGLIVEKANELKALFDHNSERLVVLNKTRALSCINTMQNALNELKAYIEEVEG